jgi:hypothetical protein
MCRLALIVLGVGISESKLFISALTVPFITILPLFGSPLNRTSMGRLWIR